MSLSNLPFEIAIFSDVMADKYKLYDKTALL